MGLWTAAMQGDGRAFTELFDAHQGRVIRHAAHLVADRSRAEDIAAAAFLELWRRRREVRIVQCSILPWLLATTTNLARNANRSLRRYESFLRSLPRSQEYSPDVAELVGAALSAEQARRLHRAMASLTSRDAALLTLTALEGYSIADAARALGMKPGTARVRLHRAKTKAREIVQQPHLEVAQ